ncbi:membrane protein [Adhaeribacter aerolatus]|uniref:Membrane protein n=1 Tax=Adhaeribacter aerolatus TaxID=670289 RepID=A0A512ARJ4_9BACT|nr:membrane protein [Adhaeribacter aerolatus]
MNPSLQQFVVNRFRHRKQLEGLPEMSKYGQAKEFLRLKVTAWHLVKDVIFILAGIISAGFGLKSFLLPNSFIDGGVTGISLLTSGLTQYPLPLLIVVINIPFLILGFTQIGKSFAIKSILAICGLALALLTITYPVITTDKLLVAAFGGFFLGAGIGLSVRGGAVLDGTEILAITLSRKTGLTIGDIVLIFNVVIFSGAAYLLSIEVALYSILTYLAASKTIDFIIEGVEEYTGVTIISSHSDEIRLMLTEQMGRGVTIYNGKRGYGKQSEQLGTVDIVFTVITRLEIARLQTEVEKIDRNAFIVMNSIKDTKGGMIKKRPLKGK